MLLITRPAEQAPAWVQRCRAAGVPAQALPLLGIHPVPAQAEVQAALSGLRAGHALMFVSPNAVAHWWRETGPHWAWPAGVWAAAPGPGTAQALMEHGVPAGFILQPPAHAEQFDAESLWAVLRLLPWAGQRVWLVQGDGGRQHLVQRWQAAGAEVKAVSVYRRGAPTWAEAEHALWQQAWRQPDSVLWLFSASESLQHLQPSSLAMRVAPAPSAEAWSHFLHHSPCLTTHPRIAEQARALGWRQVHGCRPDVAEVVATYNRLHRGTHPTPP